MVEAIILKLCFNLDELEKWKQQHHFSNYVIYAEMELLRPLGPTHRVGEV